MCIFNYAENSPLITGINKISIYIFKYIFFILKMLIIFYRFFCIFHQINPALVSTRERWTLFSQILLKMCMICFFNRIQPIMFIYWLEICHPLAARVFSFIRMVWQTGIKLMGEFMVRSVLSRGLRPLCGPFSPSHFYCLLMEAVVILWQ